MTMGGDTNINDNNVTLVVPDPNARIQLSQKRNRYDEREHRKFKRSRSELNFSTDEEDYIQIVNISPDLNSQFLDMDFSSPILPPSSFCSSHLAPAACNSPSTSRFSSTSSSSSSSSSSSLSLTTITTNNNFEDWILPSSPLCDFDSTPSDQIFVPDADDVTLNNNCNTNDIPCTSSSSSSSFSNGFPELTYFEMVDPNDNIPSSSGTDNNNINNTENEKEAAQFWSFLIGNDDPAVS